MIHQTLEGGGGVGKAKWYHMKLIMTFMYLKGCFRNVSLTRAKLVVAQAKVQFYDNFSPSSSSSKSSMTRMWIYP